MGVSRKAAKGPTHLADKGGSRILAHSRLSLFEHGVRSASEFEAFGDLAVDRPHGGDAFTELAHHDGQDDQIDRTSEDVDGGEERRWPAVPSQARGQREDE